MVGFLTEGNEENKDCSLSGTKWILRCLPFLLLKKFQLFPRNLSPDFLQYMGERPQMTSYDGMSKNAKNNKRKIK
jgi:hypothetical protein